MIACPGELQLAREISTGAGPELAAHLDACAACRAAWDGAHRAIELARRVPVRMPAPDRREELRTAILAAGDAEPVRAREGRRGMRWLAGAALAAAAAAALGLGLGRRAGDPEAHHAHGTIGARAGARYDLRSASPDEVVTLHDGSIAVEVTPLHAGERFRVITADAEVEVRGTAFEVSAQLGHLVGVSVRRGLVEVRPQGGAARVLGSGQAWAPPVRAAAGAPGGSIDPAPAPAPAAAPVAAPAPPPPAAPVAAPAPAPAAAPVPPRSVLRAAAGPPAPAAPPPPPERAAGSDPPPPPAGERGPQEVAYDEAWTAMRARDFARAAAVFARVAILDPEGPLAEDAGYWYAVALARAKRSEAATAFGDFLDRHPRSAHAREASAMLGWILVEANQRAEAERRFRAALDDPSPAVRDSARAGLSALGAR
jgi:TolA-binding protein